VYRNSFHGLCNESSTAFGINLLKPTGNVMHQQFNIQQLEKLSTIYFMFVLVIRNLWRMLSLLNPTGNVMHQQFNIQQLYVLPTLYLCVLY
jgi:hypothetical protein